MMDIADIRNQVMQRLSVLRTLRSSWEPLWTDVNTYITVRKGRFFEAPNAQNGNKQENRRLNSTATYALRMMASGLNGAVTNQGVKWFSLEMPDQAARDDDDIKIWLSESTKRLQQILQHSRSFYTSVAQLYGELTAFNTACMLIEESPDRVFRCETLTIGQYWLDNGPDGHADTLYTRQSLSVQQMASRYGIQALSRLSRAAWDNNQRSQQFIVCQAIEPNPDWIPDALDWTGKRWRQVIWEESGESDKILALHGFETFPAVCPRWDRTGNDAYGGGPSFDCLDDIKSLQITERRGLQTMEQNVAPHMLIDASLRANGGNPQFRPGGHTYVAGSINTVAKPLFEPRQLSDLHLSIEKKENRIKQAFFNDLWQMISQLDTVRTATEISARLQERLQALGPLYQNLETELLDPAIMRIFGICLKRSIPFWARGQDGVLPLPPDGAQGGMMTVKYTSVLAQAMQASRTAAIERLLATVGNMAAADPSIMDKLDLDEIVDQYADDIGVDPKLLRSPDAVAQIRDSRAKQQQQAALLQQTQAGAQAAQTLSRTDVGGGMSALRMMLGGGAAA